MIKPLLLTVLMSLIAASAFSVEHLERQAYQMREDFGTERLHDGALQHYYYISCPTYS